MQLRTPIGASRLKKTKNSLGQLQIDATKMQAQDIVNAIALPHLNIEDLCSGDNILLLLKSRGRSHPETFAHADVELIRSIVHASVAEEGHPCLKEAAAVFTEGNDTYGQLFRIADRRDSRQLLDRGVALPGIMAVLVLEFQHPVFESFDLALEHLKLLKNVIGFSHGPPLDLIPLRYFTRGAPT